MTSGFACSGARRSGYRIDISTVPRQPPVGNAPRPGLANDFLFDHSVDRRTLTILILTNEFTKDALDIEVVRSIDTDHTVRVLDLIMARTCRRPELLRMDNGRS